ncbi:MAG: indolepyruvate oxidoreductase subunit beta [Candidatus Latescibacteria bacterium 4484_7]|nr:MAG: indolepyruvate oxidoreductase subunit beta [Candidatus Latescibacteria bacterium 4484_7]
MPNDKTTNILIVGVGGQGVILASEMLSEVARVMGLDVKKSEVHGMSQRGGVVTSHVRFGKKIYSPLIPEGDADVILAFELAEALRWLYFLKPDGTVIVNKQKLAPPITTTGNFTYPEDPEGKLLEKVPGSKIVDTFSITKKLGNPRLVNTILLGVLSNAIELEEDKWLDVIEARAPKGTGELNKKAFLEGRAIK